jgi:hypothetical protein
MTLKAIDRLSIRTVYGHYHRLSTRLLKNTYLRRCPLRLREVTIHE